MKKILKIFLLIFSLSFIFGSCFGKYTFEETQLSSTSAYGGLIETQDFYIFGANDGLYKINKDGSGETQLSSTRANGGLIETQDFYIFSSTDGLYKINKDGSGETQLSSTSAYGGLIETQDFYIFSSTDGLYKINKDGSGETQLSSTSAEGGLIETQDFYIFSSNDGLYKINKDGSGETQLSSTRAYGALIETQDFYIFGGFEGLYKINKDGSGETQLSSTKVYGGLIETQDFYIFGGEKLYVGGLYQINKPKRFTIDDYLFPSDFVIKNIEDNISENTKSTFGYSFENILNTFELIDLNEVVLEGSFYRGDSEKIFLNTDDNGKLYYIGSNKVYRSDFYGEYFNISNLTGDGLKISLSEDSENIYIGSSITFDGDIQKTVSLSEEVFEKPPISTSYQLHTGTTYLNFDSITNVIPNTINQNYDINLNGGSNSGNISLIEENKLNYSFTIDGTNYNTNFVTNANEDFVIFEKDNNGNLFLKKTNTNQRYLYSDLVLNGYIEYIADQEDFLISISIKTQNGKELLKKIYKIDLAAPAGDGTDYGRAELYAFEVNENIYKLYYIGNSQYEIQIDLSRTGTYTDTQTSDYYLCDFNGTAYFSTNCINQNYLYANTQIGKKIIEKSTENSIQFGFAEDGEIFRSSLIFDYPKQSSVAPGTTDPTDQGSCFDEADSIRDSIACRFKIIQDFFTNAFNFAGNFEDLVKKLSAIDQAKIEKNNDKIDIITGTQTSEIQTKFKDRNAGSFQNFFKIIKILIVLVVAFISFYLIILKNE